jgi:hypothetical protein
LRINHSIPSTPGAISGSTTGLCSLYGKQYTIAAVTNALNYTWRTNIVNTTLQAGNPYTTSAFAFYGVFVSGQLYVKANNGCGSSAERSLTVYAKPDVPSTILGPVTLCDGQTGNIYTAAGVNFATSYGWTVPSGSLITSGQGTTTMTMTAGPNAITGNVRVRAQNTCANSAYFSKSITINNCPRLSSREKEDIYMQPNPFSSDATVYLPSFNGAAKIIIYNILGKVQQQINVEEGATALKLEKGNMNSGIYILKFNAEDNEQSIRFVIE